MKDLGHSKGDSLLDVGCAFGSRVAFFRKVGFITSGVDISAEIEDHCLRMWGIDLHNERFEEFPSARPIDIVTMIDLTEHLPSPKPWILKVRELTHVSSSLVIQTPDFDCHRIFGERWTGYSLSYEHVLFYSRQGFGSLLERHGFRVHGSLNLSALPLTVEAEVRQDMGPVPVRKVADVRFKIPALESVVQFAFRVKVRVTYQRLVSRNGCANDLLLCASRKE